MTDSIDRLTTALRESYVVERQVGEGGMATVYLARDLKHDRAVAIKVLRPELAATIGTDRFLREIEMAARLQHPHILPVYDSGAADGVLYYVMPYVEGESLRDRLTRDSAVPTEEALRLAGEVAGALAYAHAHGVVHRDIKPENILLFGGHAVVADFGIARAAQTSNAPSLTGLGMAIGTPAYMSPEQATASDSVDGRSDQYSLAAVLFEMLTGKPAFSGQNAQSVMTKSITGPRPHPRAMSRAVPPAVDAAIVRGLATDPAGRYPDMAAFATALAASRPTGPMSRKGIAALVGGGLVLVLLGAFAMSRLRRPAGPVVDAAQRIAVLPFRSSGTNVALLGEGMVDLLSTNLDGVGGIETVQPRTVLRRWKERGSATDLDGALAVGRDVKATAVLLGSVVATGPTVRLAADLYASTGEKLAHAQVDGPSDSVLSLVDGLSLALMRTVWRSKEPMPSLRVAGLTTTSIDAMRSYLQGEQFYRRSEWDSAATAFGRAVADDSTFALAQYRLAMTYGWTGNANSAAAAAAGAAAVRFASRLPPDEQSLIRAYRLFQQGRVEATDSMLRYTAAHPGDADGWYLLGESEYHTRSVAPRSPAALMEPFDRVLALDSSLTPATIHPMELALQQRDSVRLDRYLHVLQRAGATEELSRYRGAAAIAWGDLARDSAAVAALQGSPRVDAAMAGYLAIFSGAATHPDSAIARFRRVAALAPAGSSAAAQLPQILGAVIGGLGRLAAADSLAATLSLNQGRFMIAGMPIFSGFAPPGYADSIRAEARKVTPATPVDSLVNPFDLYFRSLYFLGQGDAARARPFVARGLALDPAMIARMGGPLGHGLILGVDGWRMILEGDSTRGLARIDSGLAEIGMAGGGMLTAPLRLQRAVTLAARPASRALGIELLRYGFPVDPEMQPIASLALGHALEAAGDRTGAADAYAAFIRYWSGADASLQPKVAEARAALVRLKAAGG